jgi:hypothetical protein
MLTVSSRMFPVTLATGLLDETLACNVRPAAHAQNALLNQRKLAMCGTPSPLARR